MTIIGRYTRNLIYTGYSAKGIPLGSRNLVLILNTNINFNI